MAVTYLTLYLAGQALQVVEGSQLHFIYASMGATAQPPTPEPYTRPDPFPQYVHDDEVGALVASAAVAATDPVVAGLVGNGGSQTGTALRAAFVAGRVLNNNGTVNAQKKLTVKLTADGLDIDDLIIEDVA